MDANSGRGGGEGRGVVAFVVFILALFLMSSHKTKQNHCIDFCTYPITLKLCIGCLPTGTKNKSVGGFCNGDRVFSKFARRYFCDEKKNKVGDAGLKAETPRETNWYSKGHIFVSPEDSH